MNRPCGDCRRRSVEVADDLGECPHRCRVALATPHARARYRGVMPENLPTTRKLPTMGTPWRGRTRCGSQLATASRLSNSPLPCAAPRSVTSTSSDVRVRSIAADLATELKEAKISVGYLRAKRFDNIEVNPRTLGVEPRWMLRRPEVLAVSPCGSAFGTVRRDAAGWVARVAPPPRSADTCSGPRLVSPPCEARSSASASSCGPTFVPRSRRA